MLLTRCVGRPTLLRCIQHCQIDDGSISRTLSLLVKIPARQAGGLPGKRSSRNKGQYKMTPPIDGDRLSRQFVDKLRIVATGGKGGNGCVSLEGENPTRKRPSGGSGGAGGDVYAIADSSLETLDSQMHHVNGQHGSPGGGSGKKGKTGKDAYLRVPCGTLVSEVIQERTDDVFHPWALANVIECGGSEETAHTEGANELDVDQGDWASDDDDDAFDVAEDDSEREELRYVADLEKEGDKVLLASGGKPGLGNLHVASRRVGTKLPGHRGESRYYRFELRTIADVGLVGYPNAGKSTLLGSITSAKPKVAMYPFTTLTPVVGRVEYSDTIRLRVADIPGLIDGAHRNRGLGHEFLRHVARTRGLMFVVDAAGSEGRDPVEDFMSLKEELRLYDGELAGKPAFVVANKTDLPEASGHLERLRLAADPLQVVPISALESQGLLDLVVTMRQVLEDSETKHKLDAAASGRSDTDHEQRTAEHQGDGGTKEGTDDKLYSSGSGAELPSGEAAVARWRQGDGG